MAIIFFDGFDDWGSNSATSIIVSGKGWINESGATSSTAGGRYSSSSYNQYIGNGGGSGANSLYIDLSTTITHAIVTFAQLRNSTTTPTINFLEFKNGSTVIAGFSIDNTTNNFIQAKNGAGTVLGTASIPDTGLVWNIMEFRVKVSTTVGEIEVRKNGSTIITLTGLNLGSTGVHRVRITDSSAWLFDDFYVTDNSDATGFLGELRVITLRPNGDTTQKDFVPSTGTINYDCVNEIVTNNDTDYVQSGTNSAKDIYELNNLPYTPNNVYGVRLSGIVRAAPVGPINAKLFYNIGSTAYDGSAITQTPSYIGQIFDTNPFQSLNPATGLAWTGADINALQVGIKVETI